MKRVVILDSKHYIRYRVKELIGKEDMEVYEASNYSQLLTRLGELKNSVDLIIIEINLKEEDGIEVIQKIRKKKIDIPFMVLTNLNTMDAFSRAIKEGAVDYFVKPFDEIKFNERVNRHVNGDFGINPIRIENGNKNNLHIDDYIEYEIEKARSKKYSLSIIMTVFFKSLRDLTMDINNDNMLIEDYVYGKLKSILPEVQYFEKYGFRTFIGIYPNTDEKGINASSRNMLDKIKKLKDMDSILKEYYFDNVEITFPSEGIDKKRIIDKLTNKMEEKIKAKQNQTIN
ncbi:response regulator [Clostridium algidicarnis]|uniref:response regulator n=1 Tax=Clostridium algidicarnis TaxID=37659 RepID=UPI001C0A97CF|nr:response regulator [Clostridium algidicarnis]MBU3194147.1 response regulator [Clostridium algidicarnis]MBU3203686.1 response regulator [Clostridium algidicarnis]MBU3211840.1 response regulator [Clostridium algidicarnis]MBU3221654.1 response regulator [Clostridium algidicarnis]